MAKKKSATALLIQPIRALFIYPAKSDFFVRLQIFLHAGCNFLPPKKLPPHEKRMSVVIDVYKFGQEILIICHFLEMFVQIPKNNSSQSCIKCIFSAFKKLYAAWTNKTSP
jgi:hypothetical protein